jgi:hypothetical protein
MWGYIGMTVGAIVIAWNEAEQDADTIAAHKPVDHARGAWDRFWLVGLVAVLCGVWAAFRGDFAPLVSYWVYGLGVFGFLFRLFLNSMRTLPWYYMSRSNWYDTQFLNATGDVTHDRPVFAGALACVFELAVATSAVLVA